MKDLSAVNHVIMLVELTAYWNVDDYYETELSGKEF